MIKYRSNFMKVFSGQFNLYTAYNAYIQFYELTVLGEK